MDDRAARLEHQLAAAEQITHIGSWEWELSSNVVSWSDELYRIYGLDPQSCEITFERFVSMLHPDDRDRVQGHVRAALESGGTFDYDERIVRADGKVRELRTMGRALKDGDRVVGLIGTCRDVTEERRREKLLKIYADVVANVQIGLSVWQLEEACGAGSAKLLASNPAAERIGGFPLGDKRGQSLAELFPELLDSDLPGLMVDVVKEQATRELPTFAYAAVGEPRILTIKAFPLPNDCVGLAFEDVTVRARARRLLSIEQQILEMIASGHALEDVLTTLVLLIEELAPKTIGSILLLDASGRRVRHGAAPHLPAEYNRAIEGAEIGPASGSCGTAMYTRRPVIVTDIERDPLWAKYRHLALPHGLRACWSTPILASDGRVLGSFALYYTECRAPNAGELELVARATHVAGIAIQRKEIEEGLRALSARIESAREDERTGIAREIHDTLGQALTALKMDLAWIGRRLGPAAPELRGALLAKLEQMGQMTDEIIQQVRRISTELRPGVLDDLGLVAAVEWQAAEFERRTGTPCAVQANAPDLRLERSVATAAFRIFQEALTNVARHAEATRVEVRIELGDGRLRLTVRDDGKGIAESAAASPTSLGLLGMQERARRVGGEVRVSGAQGAGTSVRVEVPYERGAL